MSKERHEQTVTKGMEMLEALGYELERTRGNFELWSSRPNEEITFNVYGGEQVAKVQTHADKYGPLNCKAEVYEAMLVRMRERAES